MSKIQTKKPFCKVCQDAGESESIYTSHWVKDLTGKTTCPRLLNTECRFCYKLGHTTKFCGEIKKMNKEKERMEKKAVEKPQKQVPKKQTPTNTFASLCEDSDSDTEPALKIEVVSPVSNSWAAIASKPKQQKPVELPVQKSGLVLMSDCIKREKQIEREEPKAAPWAQKQIQKKSWADESDSEDDEDLPEVNFEYDIEQEVDNSW